MNRKTFKLWVELFHSVSHLLRFFAFFCVCMPLDFWAGGESIFHLFGVSPIPLGVGFSILLRDGVRYVACDMWLEIWRATVAMVAMVAMVE